MNPENDRKYIRVNKLALIAVLIFVAGVFGWWLGRSNNSPASTSNSSNQQSNINNSDSESVKSLITYVLPDGWREDSCPAMVGSIYVIPAGASKIDCKTDPSSPVKISIDPGNITDCNQLQNIQNVTKHVCISLYINGLKSLKAETIYNQDSAFNKQITINAYYIDTGKKVVRIEYIHNVEDYKFQNGFDQLAKSVQAK